MRRITYKQREVSTVLLVGFMRASRSRQAEANSQLSDVLELQLLAMSLALFYGYACGGLGRSWLLLSRLGCWLSGFTVKFSAGAEFRPVTAFSLQANAQAMLKLYMNYTCTYLGETILHVWLQSGEAPVLLR